MALGDGGDNGAAIPLISDQPKHGGIVRSGSMWTAAAHVITAVIGSGVLSLAWSIAQLGWVAGPLTMLVFAAVTALQSTLFADCYRSPDPEHGPHRNRTYAGAVDRNLGTSSSWVCMLLQHTALFGYGIAYTITASISFSDLKNVRERSSFLELRERTAESTKQ
ncbi:hypothetical protein PR202_ga19988 [Eleusine coracana subsp. coracana]|uniref:Amino acid transporter transmembrane domain-containing protein n=1 Tax=Eleusine coracana subsp. coracana TaxID=191504 RepID=A0AAV5CXK1_ELECO|nr:hypothetical protein PR202_ga19988 [Eleusine coracana subsp. coracana]